MIKILYFEYPQNTNPELGYKQPECIYSLEDIAGGVRVKSIFVCKFPLGIQNTMLPPYFAAG